MKRAQGELEKPTAMTQSGTYLELPKGKSSTAEAPMHTNGGKHPGTPRMSKHPMASMTSKKGQQGNGNC